MVDRPRVILHLWNRIWGRGRRDLSLYEWHGQWRVEARTGPAGHTEPWGRTYATEDEARAVLETMRERGAESWADLTSAYQRRRFIKDE